VEWERSVCSHRFTNEEEEGEGEDEASAVQYVHYGSEFPYSFSNMVTFCPSASGIPDRSLSLMPAMHDQLRMQLQRVQKRKRLDCKMPKDDRQSETATSKQIHLSTS
jgi:hypothetical protein